MKNKIYLGIIFAGIHLFATISCIIISYAASSERFDNPNFQEGAIEFLANIVASILIQPIYGIQEICQIRLTGIFVDLPILLNSIIWGSAIVYGISKLLSRKNSRIRQK